MIKRIGISFGILVLIGVTVFSVFVLVLAVKFLIIPKHPSDLGWLEEYSTDQTYFTMQEAYELIYPLIREWNRDSYVTEASAGYLWSDNRNYWIQPDVRNRYWRFTVCSQSAGEWVSVIVNGGEVGLGVGGKPWGDISNPYDCGLARIEDVIDSNVALAIAQEHVSDIQPRNMRLSPPHPSAGSPKIAWRFTYHLPEWGSGEIKINIDAYSGDILEIIVTKDGREEYMDTDWKR